MEDDVDTVIGQTMRIVPNHDVRHARSILLQAVARMTFSEIQRSTDQTGSLRAFTYVVEEFLSAIQQAAMLSGPK